MTVISCISAQRVIIYRMTPLTKKTADLRIRRTGIMIITNCRIYNGTAGQLTDIETEDKQISRITPARGIDYYRTQCPNVKIIDARGRLTTPGMIDVHIQGAGGADVLDNSEQAMSTMSQTLARTGVTGYLATTVVKPDSDNAHIRLAVSSAKQRLNQRPDGARMLGIHLEGPYINIKKKGGLAPDSIYSPMERGLEDILDACGGMLSMMTIAPEVPGALGIIKQLTQKNIIASFAHSDAVYEETLKGFEAGISHVTHIFNAMPPLNHRHPGPLAAIFEYPGITAQIISDGHHLHPSIIKMIYRLLGKERCICITDGMQALGLPEGKYVYNGREYVSKAGAAKYHDGTLIGSTMSLARIAMNFMRFTGCSIEEAVHTVTLNPARLLGLDKRKGTLEAGRDADIVVFNDDLSVHTTIIEGEEIIN